MRRATRPRGRAADRRRADIESAELRIRDHKRDPDAYDWGVDVVGELKLKGHRLLLGNRANQKLRGPLRLT